MKSKWNYLDCSAVAIVFPHAKNTGAAVLTCLVIPRGKYAIAPDLNMLFLSPDMTFNDDKGLMNLGANNIYFL